jgi:hypothetical protein
VVLWKVGKTTTSLALISGLVKRFGKDRVGYIKPGERLHLEGVSQYDGGHESTFSCFTW